MRLTYYRITYPDGHFYIGSTTSKNVNSYLRGKHKYLIKGHKELNLSQFCFEDLKIEIKDDFSSEEDLKDFEKKEIKKYFKKNPLCLNKSTQTVCVKKTAKDFICSECGGKLGHHKDSCSRSKGKCKYCGYSLQSHRHAKDCFLYKKLNISEDNCFECGGRCGKHLKSCSKYNPPKACSECGGVRSHYDFCSKSRGRCKYCGYSLKSNRHAKDCSLYKEPKRCKYCGNTLFSHTHKKDCPLYKEPKRCKYCGYSLQSHKHTKDCPYKKEAAIT